MKIYGTYFLAFRQDKITDLLNSWMAYENYVHDEEIKHSELASSPGWLYWSLAITSMIIMPIVKTILHQGVHDWTLEWLILENSEEVAEMVFAWRPEHVNGTAEDLTEKFGTNVNQTTLIMGLLGMLMRTCHNMQVSAICDLLMQAAMVTDLQLTAFGSKLKSRTAQEGIVSMKENESCWEHYRMIRSVNKKSNKTFDGLLKMATLHNCVAFSFMLGFAFRKTEDHTHIIFYAYKLAKAGFTYYKGRKCSRHVSQKCVI